MNKNLSVISLAFFVSFLSPITAVVANPSLIEVAQESDANTEDIRAVAKEAYQEGLQLYREGTAESLRQAIVKWEEALKLWQQVGDQSQQALILNNLGAVYKNLGEKQEALNYYNQALLLRRAVGDRGGEAVTLNNIGAVYNSLGEKQKALDYYDQALPLYRAVGDRRGEATTLNNIALLQYRQGNLVAASETMQQAIEKIEFLRNQILNPQLQTSFYETVEFYYDFHINLLMELHQQNPTQGYNAQALHYSERIRARQLLTELQEASVDIKEGVDAELLAEEKQLNQQLTAALQNQG
ncbi:MAG: tetratricopeptide repeat protein, partial [Spirulinaceae cyanobacterium]